MTRISACSVKRLSLVLRPRNVTLAGAHPELLDREACSDANLRLDAQTFFLLHLSLMREYLDLEFHNIAATLPFAYNLERIIDDFITLAVFVGNDFLPHLPDLHINENALERLFDIYKRVLPDMGSLLSQIFRLLLIPS